MQAGKQKKQKSIETEKQRKRKRDKQKASTIIHKKKQIGKQTETKIELTTTKQDEIRPETNIINLL